jgi:2-polyprenyl-3-methyl-5-hydroxy-6-metoxy-1,4-benzoquinol methylase
VADTRYSYSVDLDNPTTSHSLAVLLVTPGSTVLDVGAADGSVARALAARGCRIWAVECDAAAASKAQRACERVVVGDVERLDLESVLEGRRFDFVLLLDVLEHLREPLATLERARDLLASGGRIIASIPNITHGALRLSLMLGSFTYTDTGLLDRTHLRFFDRRSAEALFADANLSIVERLRVKRGLSETEIPVDLSAVPPPVVQMLADDEDATTYQFVLVAIRSDGGPAPSGASLAERLQRRTEELETQCRELEGFARSLEQRNRERDGADEVRSELEVRMRELGQRHVELRHLQADLAVKEAFIAELRQAVAGLEGSRAETESLVATAREERDRTRVELERTRVELAHTQDQLERTQILVNSAGFRLLTKVSVMLRRYPRMYAVLRGAVRRLAGPQAR